MTGTPQVFIVESLRFAEEKQNHCEGRIISDILARSDKQCEYYYIRTVAELRSVMTIFQQSDYRYLHISCHANETSVELTVDDDVSGADFAGVIRPYLDGRRLFLSSCCMANDYFADLLVKGSGCLSMLGSETELDFRDTAILWASLYHVMFKKDDARMRSEALLENAKQISEMFGVPLKFYRRDEDSPKGYHSESIRVRTR